MTVVRIPRSRGEGPLTEDFDVRASLQPVLHCFRLIFVQWARRVDSRISALRSGKCPDRKRARRMASAQFEVDMQSAFQAKFPYTIVVRGLLGGESGFHGDK